MAAVSETEAVPRLATRRRIRRARWNSSSRSSATSTCCASSPAARVDDGKSTLIGRLLHDTRQVFDDQLSAVANDSRRWGTTGEVPDLALLVDGLQAEREQGITIDVAYRYFQTPKRKFIVADCPGHEQYTRNMATGASTAEAAVVLVDAEKGVRVQTRRHTHIVSLLGVQNVILAVNKMDRIGYDQAQVRSHRRASSSPTRASSACRTSK